MIPISAPRQSSALARPHVTERSSETNPSHWLGRSAQTGFGLIFFCVTGLALAGCGQFAGQNSPTLAASPAQLGGGPTTIPATTPATTPASPATPSTPAPVTSQEWLALNVNGAISGGVFGQTPVLSLDKSTKELVLRLPMSADIYLDGASLDITVPQLAGAKIGLEALSKGGSALTLRMPLQALMRGLATGLTPAGLPNGDSLPAIPNGELPAIAVALVPSHGIQATVYMSQAVLGIFVNTPFDPTIAMTFPIRDAAREHTYGYFSTIPAKSKNLEGGFFVSVGIPDDIARVIDDNI